MSELSVCLPLLLFTSHNIWTDSYGYSEFISRTLALDSLRNNSCGDF